jgi:hypothetical protein
LLCAVLSPVEADVESEPTLLLVDDSPVESDVSVLWAVLRPLEADVESELMPLALRLIPEEADVESDPTLPFVVASPVDAEVDNEFTALPVVLATA